MTKEKDQQKKLIEIVNEAIARDEALREQYKVGEKFRFIRDRLQTLLDRLQSGLSLLEQQQTNKGNVMSAEHETLVYVYLFNAHGLTLRSWLRMLMPKVFYEYSVNRPIYLEKAYVEEFIRSKQNKAHHGYLTVILKKNDILQAESTQDTQGHPVAKIREGSLQFEKLVEFTHNEHVYTVEADGTLTKKL